MKYNFTANPEGSSAASIENNLFDTAIGYQPAWTEYMTALSESHGQFNNQLGDLPYWVISRIFNGHTNNIPVFTSYILPNQFSYPFADQSPYAENFLISLGFDWMARRPIGKAVMPTLA